MEHANFVSDFFTTIDDRAQVSLPESVKES